MSRYTIGDNFNPKHNLAKSWWGLCLYLRTMIIYNMCIMYINAKRGQKLGVTFPSPFNSTVLSASQN